jgi:hypothetical protein
MASRCRQPVRRTHRRREDYSKPPERFNAELVMLARAAPEGKQVNGGRRWASTAEDLEQQCFNEQDAALYVVAGFTWLRQGELRALPTLWTSSRAGTASRVLRYASDHPRRFNSSTRTGS